MTQSEYQTVSIKAARNLTHTDKTNPMLVALSPKYLLKLLPWKEVPGGTLRVNRTKLILKGTGLVTIEFGDGGMPVITPEAFRQIPLFYELQPELIEAMVSKLKLQHFERGAEIIVEGEDRDTLFILANGKAELVKLGPQGEELTLKIIGPGEYLG